MTERFKLSLSGMWLLVSFFALILPIFLPSYADASNLTANSIGASTATMFVLSFPSSLFGLPLMFIANYVLGVEPNSMQGMYVNLLMLFVLGLVQWFWIVPRVWSHDADLQTIELPLGGSLLTRTESRELDDFEFFASKGQTPL